MRVKQLIVNTIWYGVVPKLVAILTILILPFITPYLTLEDYGIIGLINSYKGIAFGVATLGLHLHLTNSYFELGAKFKLLWRRLFFYILLGSFLTAFCLSVVYFFSLPITPIEKKILIIVLSVIPILFVSNETIVSHYYPLVFKPRTQVVRNLIGALASLVASFVIIRYFHLGYIGWIVGYAIAPIVVFILFIKPLYIDLKIFPQVDFKFHRIKNLLKISLPIIPHNLGHLLLSSSDRIIMDILGVSVVSIGLYSNGYQIGENANVVVLGVSVALSPVLQRIYREGNIKQMQYYYRLVNLIVSVFILLAMLWMKEFYSIFIKNDSFQPAYVIAILVCATYLVSSTVYLYLSTSIFINKNTNKILYLVFYPALLNIVLNLVFIPIYGFKVAVYTTIFTYWLVFFLPFFFPSFKQMMREMIGTRKIMLEGLLLNIFVLIVAFFAYKVAYGWKFLIVGIVALFSLLYYKKNKI
ncbi:hypothetical protein ACSQ7D_08085 [Capnocytophaga sp. G1920]|uniref:hypothetical protein n=1 Tax=Capnocytophaga sp. G1920 TaxID=3448875 RepID=UPI003EDC038C